MYIHRSLVSIFLFTLVSILTAFRTVPAHATTQAVHVVTAIYKSYIIIAVCSPLSLWFGCQSNALEVEPLYRTLHAQKTVIPVIKCSLLMYMYR